MALWLDLIPRIHRPDGFDPRYHLLDDFNNLTTFEEDELTREINMEELHFITPTVATSSKTYVTKNPILTRSSLTSSYVTWHSKQRKSTAASPSSFQSNSATASSGSSINGPDEENASSTVGMTIGVGLALLAVNLVVFAGVYCQWRRLRQSKQPSGNDVFEKIGESDYLEGTKPEPPDLDASAAAATDNNFAARRLQLRTTLNDTRYNYDGESLPLRPRTKTKSSNCGGEGDEGEVEERQSRVVGGENSYAVSERRNTLPPRRENSHYDRIIFERVSPSESIRTPPSNYESSTLV